MPEPSEKPEKAEKAAQSEKAITLNVQLTSGAAADQPVMANYTAVSMAQGIAHVDFGFIDPALFDVLGRAIKQNKPIPKGVRGTRAARIALPLEAVLRLHQQLQQTLTSLRRQAAPRKRQVEGQA
jgi:hypothetical protein